MNGINSGTIESGNDNGYNGGYAGFTILRTAIVHGWEFSYQQQYGFLPGLLKGLSGMANFTVLETEGDFWGGRNPTDRAGGRVYPAHRKCQSILALSRLQHASAF